MINLLLLLLPVAAAMGWFLGYREQREKKPGPARAAPPPSDYFMGITFLLDEQPDKAADTFSKLLLANPTETLEARLALASLRRRQGDVEKAIQLHQSLISHPEISPLNQSLALLELAKDYLAAGILDRAERLLQERITVENEHKLPALWLLLDIYEREKEWQLAIDVALQIQSYADKKVDQLLANFYCELAANAIQLGMEDQAQIQLALALKQDKTCVRASILKGELALQSQNYTEALKNFQQILQQDPRFLSEVIEPIIHCYEQLGKSQALFKFLETCLLEQRSVPLILAMSQHLQRWQQPAEASQFLNAQLQQQPFLKGIYHLILLQKESEAGENPAWLLTVEAALKSLIEQKPAYQCAGCGLQTKQLLWQCPSCQQWAQIKPLTLPW